MTTHKLEGAEIFATGQHNGLDFTEAELDGIVKSFEALGLAGRIPLKFGHGGDDARDGTPALGWVTRIYREGRKLLADFASIPQQVYDAIKAGLYKFVSVELLRDVKAGTREIPFVLDAVALLGATPPAVGTLKDLQSLATMRRRPQLQFAERLAFARDGESETEVLRAENQRLHALLLAQAQNGDVRTSRVYAAEVERFKRRYGDKGTVADWQAWVKDAPPVAAIHRPGAIAAQVAQANRDGRDELPADATPDVELVHLARAEVEKSGGKLTFSAASNKVLRENPELANRYRYMPGVKDQ